ncbi:hypothetical protein C7T35_12810 [Variovorax sp. WS11]|uniref:hypothetical protein n=1 Tax=Variovorax sp. WS11 TaxID=1105204 RepID=UPI000D0CCDAE|nr:hypothetical protein [Variovorax sp. WS11]NDZ14363.1 hypothetical protein [Variovorax sp. WS11]PSL84078.1 hypothetical protein C7T35_12810 [Variovorax sp. WS11]
MVIRQQPTDPDQDDSLFEDLDRKSVPVWRKEIIEADDTFMQAPDDWPPPPEGDRDSDSEKRGR